MWSLAGPILAGRFSCASGEQRQQRQQQGDQHLELRPVASAVDSASVCLEEEEEASPSHRPSRRTAHADSPSLTATTTTTTPSTTAAAATTTTFGTRSAAECEGAGEVAAFDNDGDRGTGTPLVRPSGCRRLCWLPCRLLHSCWARLNPPLKASLFGIVAGLTPSFQSFAIEEAAPLRWLVDAMQMLGAGAIPLVVFVLGANLSGGTKGGCGVLSQRTLGAILVAKLLVVPAINLAMVVAALRSGALPDEGDGLLPLALLIVGASPAALNINTIATMQGTFVREVAAVMFYMYLLSAATVPLFATAGLLLFV